MKKHPNYIKLEHSNPEHNNVFVVNWMAGNTCNYKCTYCPDYLHDGSSPWISYQTAIDFCNKIISQYSSKKIVFEFTGGEITMWPDFIKVAKYLHEHHVDISIISNGSRTLRWWEEATPFLKRVHLSYHAQHANQEHFEHIISFLQDKVSLHVNIMMLPESFDTCNNIANHLEEKYTIAISKQPLVWNLNGPIYIYPPKHLQILAQPSTLKIHQTNYRGEMVKIYPDGKKESHSCNYFISSNENNWQDWLCYIGIEQIVVTKEGDIYRGWCMSGDKIGNINQPHINFPTRPIICDKHRCSCNFDIMCTKTKSA